MHYFFRKMSKAGGFVMDDMLSSMSKVKITSIFILGLEGCDWRNFCNFGVWLSL